MRRETAASIAMCGVKPPPRPAAGAAGVAAAAAAAAAMAAISVSVAAAEAAASASRGPGPWRGVPEGSSASAAAAVSRTKGGALQPSTGPPPPTLYERWTTATRSTLCGDNWAGTLPALLTLPAALTGVPERFSRRGGRWPLVPVNNTVLVRRPFPPSLTSCHHVFLSITATAADAELRGKGEDARRTERR